MGAIEHLTISLPVELADAMRLKIADGTFADMGEFIEAALLSLTLDRYAADHPSTEDDVRRQVVAAMEEYDRDPSTGRTVDEVQEHLAARRAMRRLKAA